MPWPPQTLSLNGPVCRVVPPTPVAYGWPAGSSTARPLNPNRWQSDAPSSPDAEKNDMPATAISCSSWLVAASWPRGSAMSHRPQLSDTTLMCRVVRWASMASSTAACEADGLATYVHRWSSPVACETATCWSRSTSTEPLVLVVPPPTFTRVFGTVIP